MDKISSTDIKPSDIKNQLGENIANIAKEYVEDDEKYFPLGENLKNFFSKLFFFSHKGNKIFSKLKGSLIDSLEFVSLSRGFEPDWGSSLLRKMNIPFNKLIQEYNSVYLKKDIKWAENSSRFINAIYSLIELFTKAPNATNDSDK